MKILVRLYGTLSRKYPGYDPEKGLDLELPEGSRVGDLLARLRLGGEGNRAVVAVDGLIRNSQDEISEGAVVNVLEAVYGG